MEKAFKVKKDSKLYQDYFTQKEEKRKFEELGDAFFNEIGYQGTYSLTKRLMVQNYNCSLSQFFPNELCKTATAEGFYKFKVKSPTQKKWEEEVISKIDMTAFNSMKFWYINSIYVGRYTIWDYNNEIYGYFQSNDDIRLTKDMEEIKMSEYYKIIEEIKDENQRLADS